MKLLLERSVTTAVRAQAEACGGGSSSCCLTTGLCIQTQNNPPCSVCSRAALLRIHVIEQSQVSLQKTAPCGASLCLPSDGSTTIWQGSVQGSVESQRLLQAEQAALEKQIAASQRASESEARLQEQSQVRATHGLPGACRQPLCPADALQHPLCLGLNSMRMHLLL